MMGQITCVLQHGLHGTVLNLQKNFHIIIITLRACKCKVQTTPVTILMSSVARNSASFTVLFPDVSYSFLYSAPALDSLRIQHTGLKYICSMRYRQGKVANVWQIIFFLLPACSWAFTCVEASKAREYRMHLTFLKVDLTFSAFKTYNNQTNITHCSPFVL